tara:strand:- start:1300 stop:1794 length:495 start_codon:yes stop_codon:yes gene_type:complete
MNYLNLLNDDIIEKILNNVANNYENDLNKLSKKINKLKYKLKPLIIEKSIDIMNPEYTSIDYGYVNYSMGEYLFDTFDNEEYVVLFNKCNEDLYVCKSYFSKKLKNPTYLDILIEANKAYKNANYLNNRFLEGLHEIHHSRIYKYTGIIPKYNNVRYFEFMLCS